jgi:hypothetical protein
MEQEMTPKSKEQQMFSLIAGHKASAMTVKDFCELYDLSQGRYYYWQKKYRASQLSGSIVEQSSFTLLKAEINPSAGPSEQAILFAECRGIKIYQQVSAGFLKEIIG